MSWKIKRHRWSKAVDIRVDAEQPPRWHSQCLDCGMHRVVTGGYMSMTTLYWRGGMDRWISRAPACDSALLGDNKGIV